MKEAELTSLIAKQFHENKEKHFNHIKHIIQEKGMFGFKDTFGEAASTIR